MTESSARVVIRFTSRLARYKGMKAMTNWQLAEAKNKLSEVVNKALTVGPQRIRRRDDAVVVISEAEYQRLTGERMTFKEFLLASPDFSDVDLSRDQSPMREVEL